MVKNIEKWKDAIAFSMADVCKSIATREIKLNKEKRTCV